MLEPVVFLRDQWVARKFFSSNVQSRRKGAEDGSPIPPVNLIRLVTGVPDVRGFLQSGKAGAQTVLDMLESSGIRGGKGDSVLDFGCGCGRVIRHLKCFSDLYGTDYNRNAVEWCAANLQFAQFATNELGPPLRYYDGQFSLVYAFSVFTHLPEDIQIRWIEEFRRIIRAGGHLIISTHGSFYLEQLNSSEQQDFQNGRLVLKSDGPPGSNRYCAYHPYSFVAQTLSQGFQVAQFVPEGAKGNPMQDLYLLSRI